MSNGHAGVAMVIVDEMQDEDGDSNTETSYAYVKSDHEDVGDEGATEFLEDSMTSSTS